MKYTKLLSILAMTGTIVFSPTVQAGEKGDKDRKGQAGQRGAKGQKGQKGGGIFGLLQQVGATKEQMQKLKDARSKIQNAQDRRAAFTAELKSILTEEQFKKFEEAMKKARGGQGQGKRRGKGERGKKPQK